MNRSESVDQFWFKPRRYGYGAAPANWKGWAATAAYLLITVALTIQLIVREAGPAGPAPAQWMTWVVVLLVLTAAFLVVVRAKTDGQWRWRWGK